MTHIDRMSLSTWWRGISTAFSSTVFSGSPKANTWMTPSDGSPWLPTWLYLEWTKNLSSWTHLWEIFPDWIIWGQKTHPKSGSYLLEAAYIKDTEEVVVLASLPHSQWQAHMFCCQGVPSVVLEPTTSSRDIRPQGQNNYWILELFLWRQLLLD